MKTVKDWLINNIPWLVPLFVLLVCVGLALLGTPAEDGTITFNGKPAEISEATKKWIESASEAYYRVTMESRPTDEETIEKYKNGLEGEGRGGSTTLEQVKSRRLPDGDTDDGKGWQCSKYTAYLATGQREYSYSHPDYGPVNGKDVAQWLVDNFGWKYTDKPVEGAIGSGGFNTTYGHTAEFLYWTGDNTAMVSDANWLPLTVATHNMNVDGWVWVVPGDYTPDPEPEPTPTPTPTTGEVYVNEGSTMGQIMLEQEGYVEWGEKMNRYADSWCSTLVVPGQSVYYGWTHGSGYGLFANDIIKRCN